MGSIHQEFEYISPGSTAEAVEDLLFLIDHKGRGLFGMEWTESFVVLACFFEGYIVRDDFEDVGPIANFRYFLF